MKTPSSKDPQAQAEIGQRRTLRESDVLLIRQMDEIRRLTKLNAELLKALKAAKSVIAMCYDSSEDNHSNPSMQRIGKTLKQTQTAIAKAERKQS